VILDTNALSAVVDGDPDIRPLVERAESVAIPVIALGEFRFGIAQSRRAATYESWIRENLRLYGFLPVDEDTAASYAEIRLEQKQQGVPLPVNDLWIAALCRQHRLPILSRDRHFDAVKGLRRLRW